MGGWSDTNRRMFDDRTLVTPTVDDNSVLYDKHDKVMDAAWGVDKHFCVSESVEKKQ